MMNHVILALQIACFAFLAWGGVLSLQCLIQSRDFEFPGRELKPA